MANKRKYIYGEQFAQTLPGSNQNFYFRTVTTYEVDNNGNPIPGTAGTNLYYSPFADGKVPGTGGTTTWTPGTANSIDNFKQGGWVLAGLTADGAKTYTFERYTQEDANLGRIPPGKNVGDQVLGATAQQSLSTSGGRFYEAVQNNLINLAANTQPGLAAVVSAKQKNAAGGGDPQLQNVPSIDIPNIEGVTDRNKPNSYGPFYYPLTLDIANQDVIKFTILTPGRTKINPNFTQQTFEKVERQALGQIFLPIQPSISDSNTVDWSGLQLNAIEAYAAGSALDLMKSSSVPDLMTKAGAKLGQAMEQFKLNRDELGMGANVYLAQQALGIQGLLSRTTGAILNPNLELLFNGPQLRAFNFTFKMSARSADEAYQVRSIIRSFKQAMSVKTTASNVFLKSPHVFDIEYLSNTKSIGQVKTCALLGCDVDYTPDGTFMSYNDENRTMTSYQMSLRFSEIEPIYDKDYAGMPEDQIGF